jgi:type I restriction enzyme R subunit
MQAFVTELLRAEDEAGSVVQAEKAHAALYRFLAPAVDRFIKETNEDPDRAEEFRSSLSDYVRAYGFLAQVIGYGDPDLERLHLYGRHLLNRLPRVPDAGVDIGETTLSHFQFKNRREHDLRLGPVGEQILPGFSPDAAVAHEADEQPLREVIEELNERFGADLGTSDEILIIQQIASLVEDPKMQAIGLVNNEEKFGQVADDRLDEIVARNMERNTAFSVRYFDDPEFQAAIKQTARRRAYNLINNPARDEALRQLRATRSLDTGDQ